MYSTAAIDTTTMDTTTAVVTTVKFEDDIMLFRYKTCNNMSADVTSYLPLCTNQTALVDNNETDDEIRQVNTYLRAESFALKNR